jgi:hypothetical protein
MIIMINDYHKDDDEDNANKEEKVDDQKCGKDN